MSTDSERIAALEANQKNMRTDIHEIHGMVTEIKEQQDRWTGAMKWSKWLLPLVAGAGWGIGEIARHIPWK